ncbi:MAG: hypothetical protein L6R28_24770 [Planctomycetes bacterium]|nr:hypothetical protein [Planctomycetota bacterium]
MQAKIFSAAAQGVEALGVEVEVDVASHDKNSEAVVGLPDAAVKESIHRVRAALNNSGFFWPLNARITVNLAPADMRKEGPIYDLPIALGLMQAADQLGATGLQDYVIAGELAMDGRVRPVKGALLFALQARAEKRKGLLVPEENAAEAAVVDGVNVYGVGSLAQAVGFLTGSAVLEPVRVDLKALFAAKASENLPDLADVKGQEHVKRALTVAAAGSVSGAGARIRVSSSASRPGTGSAMASATLSITSANSAPTPKSDTGPSPTGSRRPASQSAGPPCSASFARSRVAGPAQRQPRRLKPAPTLFLSTS